MWLPLGRVACIRLFQHAIDLLKGETLRLGDEEVGVDPAANAKRTPDEEDLGAKIALIGANHVGGDDSNDLQNS